MNYDAQTAGVTPEAAGFVDVVLRAAMDLLTKDVPGSLFVLSLALNGVLLLPYILKATRRAYRG